MSSEADFTAPVSMFIGSKDDLLVTGDRVL